MADNNCFGIPIEDLKTRIEDMVESDEDFWSHESEDDTDSLGNKKSHADSGSEEEREDDSFFEGAEKLLEIWFTTKSQHGKEGDLRNIPRCKLEEMLLLAKCEIISCMKNSEIDAYVLSESSLFISKRRMILKTCGTTTPLDCIERIIDLVREFTKFDMIEDIYYSRKNFKRPLLQRSQHKSFEKEVNTLDRLFRDGAAYCMGTMNKDCWYMYTLNPIERYVIGKEYHDCDQTIEILMNDLDPEIMNIFYKCNTDSACLATKKAGILKLVPGMKIDDCLFEPCGYSMNAISDRCKTNNEGGVGDYATIHITPEPEFSYVSFETNIATENYMDLVIKVVDTFKPSKLIVTFYATRNSKAVKFHEEMKACRKIDDFRRNDIQFCSFQDCDMTYAHFCKPNF